VNQVQNLRSIFPFTSFYLPTRSPLCPLCPSLFLYFSFSSRLNPFYLSCCEATQPQQLKFNWMFFLSVGGRPTKNVSVTVSAPSIWNSLSYKCRSAELLSAFKRTLRLKCLTLPIVNVNTLPSLCHYAPLIRLRHTALYKCVLI